MRLQREDVGRVARKGGDAAEAQALALFARIAEQDARIEKLERRLGQNSRNSSLPPSSDRPDRSDEGRGAEKPKPKPRPRKALGEEARRPARPSGIWAWA